jgi:hypothetical protein
LLAVAATLDIPFPERQQAMKGQRSKLHTLPLETTLQYGRMITVSLANLSEAARNPY